MNKKTVHKVYKEDFELFLKKYDNPEDNHSFFKQYYESSGPHFIYIHIINEEYWSFNIQEYNEPEYIDFREEMIRLRIKKLERIIEDV